MATADWPGHILGKNTTDLLARPNGGGQWGHTGRTDINQRRRGLRQGNQIYLIRFDLANRDGIDQPNIFDRERDRDRPARFWHIRRLRNLGHL